MKLPVEFGPSRNVAWKAALPEGHSSLIVWGDRIFLTGGMRETHESVVLSLSRETGQLCWRAAIKVEKSEKVHTVGNPATATPASDGERVIGYFGSPGAICHDFQGHEVWRYPPPCFDSRNGSGTSPALADGTVYPNRDIA